MEQVRSTRRTLLVAGLAWLAVLPRIVRGQAAQTLPHLDETEKIAVTLGYYADATKVDASKFPTYKADQRCSNCEQVGGKDGEKWRSCKLVKDKLVAEGGWCKVWIKKKPTA